MIRIEKGAWGKMLDHATRLYPNECCGTMLGRQDSGVKSVARAIPLDNVFRGPQSTRYELRPEDLLEADRLARQEGLSLIGIYHSHPDCDAYFSRTDLENSCPWYSFLVLSVRGGKFDHANCWVPDTERTAAAKEEVVWQES